MTHPSSPFTERLRRVLTATWAKLLLCVLGACATLFATGWALSSMPLELRAVELRGAREVPVSLPWSFQGPRKQQTLRLHYRVQLLSPRSFRIVPDDEFVALRVNGAEVPLTRISPKALRDYNAGFSIDLSPWLHTGDNQIDLVLTNHDGPGGLKVAPRTDPRMALVWLAGLPWLWGLCWLFGLRRGPVLVLSVALAIACAYWANTTYNERSYDVFYGGGHMGYIETVAKTWAPPNPQDGWTFYHPPLYYTLGAIVRVTALRFGWPVDPMLQGLSLWLWQLFLVSGAATIVRSLPTRVPAARALLAIALLAFWPSNFLHAVRVGNDAALVAFAGLTTFFLITWWNTGAHLRLVLAALTTALALASKSNASVLAAALLALLGLWLWREHLSQRRWPDLKLWVAASVACLLLGLGVAATFGNAYYHYRVGHTADWLIGNVKGLDDGMLVPVDIESFLPLDLPTFLTEPWVFTRGQGTGRTNFWNFMLRSSISGEFAFPGKALRGIAIALGVLLVLLLAPLAVWPFRAHSLRAAWQRGKRTFSRYAPWFLLGAAWFFSLLSLRIKVPYACSNDFRYISPILVPLAFALAHRGRFSALVQLLMVALSALFFVVFAWT